MKRQEETWCEYQTRTSIMARKIWVQMKFSFLYEKIAESMRRAMGWVCHEKTNTVLDTLMKVYVEKYEMVAIPTQKNDERRS